MIFQNSVEINKKEKDKTGFENHLGQEVKWTVVKVEGDGLPGFGVQGGKLDLENGSGR